LLDIGNTHTHAGLARAGRLRATRHFATAVWHDGSAGRQLGRFVGRAAPAAVALASVVPRATRAARGVLRALRWPAPLVLTDRTLVGVGLDYPEPGTIGPDRLANAVAAFGRFGAPVVVLDFGTAVTFDVVDARGCYVGGIIAPGLSAMTDYLHEKTALLPAIKIRAVRRFIGRTTVQAMRIGAVHGYRGLVRELLHGLSRELDCARLPVVATGGYALLLAAGLPEIQQVRPCLTLEGLLRFWHLSADESTIAPRGQVRRKWLEGPALGASGRR